MPGMHSFWFACPWKVLLKLVKYSYKKRQWRPPSKNKKGAKNLRPRKA
jgi:transposase